LCKESDETITRLLISYTYVTQFWKGSGLFVGFKIGWSSSLVEKCFRRWDGNVAIEILKALLVIVGLRDMNF